jgi:hypothetical protein
MVRTIFAGVAGGIAMFLWTSIAHMATPLGEMGVQGAACRFATRRQSAASPHHSRGTAERRGSGRRARQRALRRTLPLHPTFRLTKTGRSGAFFFALAFGFDFLVTIGSSHLMAS